MAQPEMTPELQRVEEIFHAALDCEPNQLDTFLDERCGGNKILRGKVEDLLAAHRVAGEFIETPVGDLARSSIGDGHEGDLLVGQIIGHYKILRRISAGGMGAVYLAERADQQYKKQVAIKLIKRGMDTESVLRHFRNERQILASFDHPNIAHLLDGGVTENGLPYFVMEYVEGLPIDRYSAQHTLSINDRLKLFREVCSAVSYAHRHAVIHRDIKPSNILFTSDGTPKLLDFGIARILQPADGVESLATMTGLRLMTPEYASPEQIRGQPVTTATDVYSLGVVLYQLLTGHKPYRLKTRTPEEISRAILEQEPVRPSTAIAERDGSSKSQIPNSKLVRGDLDNIVLMALRKGPERRYRSVEQFSEDIRRHLESLPVLARKDTFAYRAAKFVRRNTVPTAAAALLFLSLLGGIIATTWQAHRAKLEKARAERRFNDVRQLAHSVLFDYHDAIKDLPGATRVRERLVKDALIYLDSLAREASGDRALQRELAAAYERVGDVRGRAFSANLGDVTGAMDSYQKGLRIREALVAADPHNVQDRRDVAASYVRIGIQLIHTNEAARGTDYLRKALSVYLQLNTEQPTNSEIRYDLAATYNELGLALEDWWRNASGALENHRKALSLREEFLAADPGSQTHRRNLSMTYVNIGRALVQSGNVKGGLESNQKGLAIREALFFENPTNADFRRLLAIGYQNDGKYRETLHDMHGALGSFRRKLALDEESLADDPVNAQTREDLAYSCEKMGDLLAETEDYLQALSYYRRALFMYEEVSAVAPQILRVHYRVIFARTGIAQMQAKRGERTDALAECSKASALLNELPEDPGLIWQGSVKGELYMRLARAYTALATSTDVPTTEQREHWGAARNMYARSLDIWQDMQKRGMLTGEDSAKPQEVAREIAKCDAPLQR
jgi:serine/threonine protein kinase